MTKTQLSLTAFPFLIANSLNAVQKPNIVFILADDLGYSDVGYMKQKNVKTPNIDRLASEGMYFTNAYAACPVCSPTRASILTGKYPATLHLTCHIPGVGMEKYLAQKNKGKPLMEAEFIDHLPVDEITFAELAKAANYNTAFLGKWHLGGEGSQKTTDGIVNANYHPDKQGFDINLGGCAYGQPASYFSPYKNGTLDDGEDGEYLTDRLGDDAVKYMTENNPEKTGKPFLLYLSTYTVHTPFQVPKETIDENNGNKYFAMIQKLDENIGKVLKALEELGLEENTFVIFYSDNGGLYNNPPLSGKKGDLLEGGIKVPFIAKWPGKITSGTVCDQPITSVDILPTLAEIMGLNANTIKGIEGKSIIPLLSGNNNNFEKRAIYWHFPHHRYGSKWVMGAAIREGDWKLIWLMEKKEIHLFNLKEDGKEKNNLYETNKEKADYLLSKLKDMQKKSGAVMPKPNPEYIEKN